MPGPLIVPVACMDLYRKINALAKDAGTSFRLIYLAFETVDSYLNAPDKDKSHWRTVLFTNYCMEYIQKYSNPNLSENTDPRVIQLLQKVRLPLNLSMTEDEDEKKQLMDLAKGDVIRRYHLAGLYTAKFEINYFIDKYGKHPFDYVLEDLKDDIPTFLQLERGFQLAEGSN